MILVTGGAGFIGANFVLDWLRSCDEPVVNLDALTYAGNESSLDGLPASRFRLVEGSICDPRLVDDLVGAHDRSEKSHAIAQRHRPALEKIAAAHGARVKVVEVPPGPPVMSPIVAEVYGPDQAGRAELAQRVAQAFAGTPDIVGVDTSLKEHAPRAFLRIQRQRAESLGIPVQVIAQTVYAALSGSDAAYLHDGHAKFAVPVRIQLDEVPPGLQLAAGMTCTLVVGEADETPDELLFSLQ